MSLGNRFFFKSWSHAKTSNDLLNCNKIYMVFYGNTFLLPLCCSHDYTLGRYNIPPRENFLLNLKCSSQNKTNANLPPLLLCHGPSIRKQNSHTLQIQRFNHIVKQAPLSFISYQHLHSDDGNLIYADVLRQLLNLPVAHKLLVRVVF